MTGTPPPVQQPPQQPVQRPAKPSRTPLILIIIGVGLVVLAIVVGAIVAAVSVRGAPLDIRSDVPAGRSVSVDIPNATLSFGPSTDGQVHVTARGFYLGPRPTIVAETSNGVTTIVGDCGKRWFSVCNLDVTVTLPARLPLTADGQNGSISASELTGSLRLTTVNGGIDTDGTRGRLDLRTTNGKIRVLEAESRQVTAGTTNGSVEMDFTLAPTTVAARSTNGSITIRVPVGRATYYVSAQTTNGTIDTESIRTDQASERTITAETTNGNVTIVPR